MPCKIPPIAHFIWAGGKKLLPDSGVENISNWIKQNKDVKNFQAWLWIDEKTAPEGMVDTYKQFFKAQGIEVLTEEEADTFDLKNKKPPPLILKDISKNNLRDEYVAYEIDKLQPNYGSSSDLLRYDILYKYGGFYCDCTDVKPGANNLELLFSQQYNSNNILYLEHLTQTPRLTEQEELEEFNERLKGFDLFFMVGNDTFATNQGNEIALKLAKKARANYDLIDVSELIEAAHSGKNIKESTIVRTGPGAVRRVLESLKLIPVPRFNSQRNSNNEVRRFRDGNLEFVTPSDTNTGKWLMVPVTKYLDNYQIAIEQIIQTIKFEATNFKILRLDDHVRDFMDSTNNAITIKEVLIQLDKTIKSNAKNIQYMQLTGEFKETIDYAKDYPKRFQCENIFDLEQVETIIFVLNAQCFFDKFIKAENDIKGDFLQEGRNPKDPHLLADVVEALAYSLEHEPDETKQRLCENIKLATNYIQHFSECFDQLKVSEIESQKIKNYLVKRLKIYGIYAETLNVDLVPEQQVDTKKIAELIEKLSPKKEENLKPTVVPKGP